MRKKGVLFGSITLEHYRSCKGRDYQGEPKILDGSHKLSRQLGVDVGDALAVYSPSASVLAEISLSATASES